jgi:hypothetical protein
MNESVHASTVVLDREDCIHARTHVELMPPGAQHYGRVVCEDCGKQLCWKPSPANVDRRRRNTVNLNKLLGTHRLTEWEKGFCQALIDNPRLSPRQQRCLDGLVSKYLEDIQNDPQKRNGDLRQQVAA